MSEQFLANEKNSLSRLLVDKILGAKGSISLAEIQFLDVPEIFKICAGNHARARYEQDTPIVLKDSETYDFESSEIQSIFAQLKDALIQSSHMPREEISTIADEAIDLQIEIISRPRFKFMDLLFGQSARRKKKDILTIASGFGEDRLFIKHLMDKIGRIVLTEVDREKIASLACQAEDQTYKERPISAFLHDINLYLHLSSQTRHERDLKVPSPVLLAMLEERRLNSLLQELQANSDQKEQWSTVDIETLFERHLLVGDFDPGFGRDQENLQDLDVLDLNTSATTAQDRSDTSQPMGASGSNLTENQPNFEFEDIKKNLSDIIASAKKSDAGSTND